MAACARFLVCLEVGFGGNNLFRNFASWYSNEHILNATAAVEHNRTTQIGGGRWNNSVGKQKKKGSAQERKTCPLNGEKIPKEELSTSGAELARSARNITYCLVYSFSSTACHVLYELQLLFDYKAIMVEHVRQTRSLRYGLMVSPALT